MEVVLLAARLVLCAVFLFTTVISHFLSLPRKDRLLNCLLHHGDVAVALCDDTCARNLLHREVEHADEPVATKASGRRLFSRSPAVPGTSCLHG